VITAYIRELQERGTGGEGAQMLLHDLEVRNGRQQAAVVVVSGI
jgi:hypothetical protein